MEEDGEKTELTYKGYDKSTDSLRYGFKPQKHDKRIFWIKCGESGTSLSAVCVKTRVFCQWDRVSQREVRPFIRKLRQCIWRGSWRRRECYRKVCLMI